jgi:hypothetical protein
MAGVRRAYPPEKLARLTAVKEAWDPDNAFHLNHNIQPHQLAGGSELATGDHRGNESALLDFLSFR